MYSFLNTFLFNFIYAQKKTSQKPADIYTSRKSPDSPGGLGFKRTRKINFRVISKKFQKSENQREYK